MNMLFLVFRRTLDCRYMRNNRASSDDAVTLKRSFLWESTSGSEDQASDAHKTAQLGKFFSVHAQEQLIYCSMFGWHLEGMT